MKITIEFSHEDDDGNECCDNVTIEVAHEPSEWYGADADGNRGMHIPGYWFIDDTPPESCSVCSHDYTDAEIERMGEQILQQVETDY